MRKGLAFLPLAGAFLSGCSPQAPTPSTPPSAQATEQTVSWAYDVREDSMSGRAVVSAAIQTPARFELGFPYAGPQRATLLVRNHPRQGAAAAIAIERGQLLCRTGGCELLVRFDDEPAKPWKFVKPASLDSEMLFVDRPGPFIAAIHKAKRVRVETQVYQEGAIVLDFPAEGLSHERMQWDRR